MYNYKSEINLTKNEHLALNNLSNNKNIIQKSDKSNSIVLLDKDKYLEGMSIILNKNTKFEMLQFDHDKELNYHFKFRDKKIIYVLKDLKNKEDITEVDYNHLHPCDSCPGILYGIVKVHMPVLNQCPSLQSILSTINTPSYKVVNFLFRY